MVFKMYNCDFGVKVAGVDYAFDNVDSMTIEDPQTTNLVRGANAGDTEGLVFVEGIKDPKTITVTILGMTAAIKELLDGVYADKSRVDVYCIDRTDGSSKIGKNSILAMQPLQLTVDDTPESMNVQLVFKTFDMQEVHKT